MQHWRLIFVLATTLITPAPAQGADTPLVFVSIPPQKSFVEQVAGSLVHVQVLLPPGASPATYEPTPHQMASLKHADLYLSIGVPFEGRLLQKVAELIPELQIIDCRRGVELVPMEGHRHGVANGASFDPHIWLDPMRVKIIAGTIVDGIGGLLPGATSDLNRNLGAFRDALDRVDARVGERLAAFSGRELLVFHPAYGYFARRYGLRQLAVEVEGKAPSARQLAELVRVVRDSGQTTIFAQPQFSSAAAKTVAEALGCAVVELDPLAENYLVNLVTMSERISAALARKSHQVSWRGRRGAAPGGVFDLRGAKSYLTVRYCAPSALVSHRHQRVSDGLALRRAFGHSALLSAGRAPRGEKTPLGAVHRRPQQEAGEISGLGGSR